MFSTTSLDRLWIMACAALLVISFGIIYYWTVDYAYSLFTSLIVGLTVPLIRFIIILATNKG
jgi:hypothetical protein